MGVGVVEGVDINWSATVVGLRSRRNYCIGNLVNECTGAIRVSEVPTEVRRLELRCQTVLFSGVGMPVVGCNSERKKGCS